MNVCFSFSFSSVHPCAAGRLSKRSFFSSKRLTWAAAVGELAPLRHSRVESARHSDELPSDVTIQRDASLGFGFVVVEDCTITRYSGAGGPAEACLPPVPSLALLTLAIFRPRGRLRPRQFRGRRPSPLPPLSRFPDRHLELVRMDRAHTRGNPAKLTVRKPGSWGLRPRD